MTTERLGQEKKLKPQPHAAIELTRDEAEELRRNHQTIGFDKLEVGEAFDLVLASSDIKDPVFKRHFTRIMAKQPGTEGKADVVEVLIEKKVGDETKIGTRRFEFEPDDFVRDADEPKFGETGIFTSVIPAAKPEAPVPAVPTERPQVGHGLARLLRRRRQ